MYVGHTHEDIDAGFSRISNSLSQNEAETLPDLLSLLPDITEIKGGMYDVSGWLAPHINDVRKHTKPLHYKFTKSHNSCKVHYKGQHDQPWKELAEPLFTRNIPSNSPIILEPEFDKINIEKKETACQQWKNLFKDNPEESSFNWWRTWLAQLKDIRDNKRRQRLYIESEPKWILPQLPRQPAEIPSTVTDQTPSVPASLQQMLEAESAVPEVRILN